MKPLPAIAAVALVSFGFANAASALQRTYLPANTAFTANGSIALVTVAGSLPCNTVWTGSIVNGAGSITGATFHGSGTAQNRHACANLSATGLPWQMLSYGASGTGINFTNVGFALGGVGSCGPAYVKGSLGQGGKLTFSGAGVKNCSLSGTLTTTPPIRINLN